VTIIEIPGFCPFPYKSVSTTCARETDTTPLLQDLLGNADYKKWNDAGLEYENRSTPEIVLIEDDLMQRRHEQRTFIAEAKQKASEEASQNRTTEAEVAKCQAEVKALREALAAAEERTASVITAADEINVVANVVTKTAETKVRANGDKIVDLDLQLRKLALGVKAIDCDPDAQLGNDGHWYKIRMLDRACYGR
jgi:hypothetical protein